MSKQFKRLSTVFAKSLGLSTEQLEASFRLATIEEVQTVSSMRRRVFGCSIKDDDERYLEWRYYSHPGFSSTLWVFEYRGEVIGAMGTEPVELLNCGVINQQSEAWMPSLKLSLITGGWVHGWCWPCKSITAAF